jgi:hypothetical protein
MIDSTIANDRTRREVAATETFLESPNDESFTELFLRFSPQLVSFFRSHSCTLDLSEDISQEVMLTVYRKAGGLRDRTQFRAWLFTIGRHVLYRHHGKQPNETVTVDLECVIDARTKPAGPPAFEFSSLDDVVGITRARSADSAVCRGLGVSRDRRGKSDPDRDGSVASFQRQEKASGTPEGIWASQKRGSLI